MASMDALQGFVGFSSIAAVAIFFSYRLRLFVRIFVPREDLWSAGRNILRDPNSGQGMRFIALLQFTIATIFGLIGLWRFLIP